MLMFSLFVQVFHGVVWGMVLAGSVILLRRGYASAGVSMFFGAAIALLMGLLNVFMTTLMMLGVPHGVGPGKIMMMAGLASAVGLFLFALGFLQLARMIKREG